MISGIKLYIDVVNISRLHLFTYYFNYWITTTDVGVDVGSGADDCVFIYVISNCCSWSVPGTAGKSLINGAIRILVGQLLGDSGQALAVYIWSSAWGGAF